MSKREATLPDGAWIEVRRLPTGVRNFSVHRVGTAGAVLTGTTYPGGGAYVEHEGLDAHEGCCCGGYSNSESFDTDGLRIHAALYAMLAEDLEERERSTSADILVRFGHDTEGRTYAFECNYPCPVGSEVEVHTRGRWQAAVVAELGTGGFEGRRASAKLVKVPDADE